MAESYNRPGPKWQRKQYLKEKTIYEQNHERKQNMKHSNNRQPVKGFWSGTGS